MGKKTIIQCTKDVIVNSGQKTFTKGKFYIAYPYSYQTRDSFKKVTCAKNDQKEQHIIIDEDEEFFNSHFKID